MANLKFSPVRHDHGTFLAKARARKGFAESYDALAFEYQVADQLLRAARAGRAHAGCSRGAQGATKSAISRLESAGEYTPSLSTLQRYARALRCDIQVKLVPQK